MKEKRGIIAAGAIVGMETLLTWDFV